MDYYESVVLDYLRADRAVFVNRECCIQINKARNPDTSGPHWYCDAVVADFRSKTVFLCDISYGTELVALTKRLKDWQDHWEGIVLALRRDSSLPEDWPIRVWLFVPEHLVPLLQKRLTQIGSLHPLKFVPKVTELEKVQPWFYSSWNREDEVDMCETTSPEMDAK
jgi:hypothetical protein